MLKAKSYKLKTNQGFTLIEMMVALSLFSVVVTVAFGALMTLIDSNKKAQAIETLMTNINFVIDDISRNARVGSNFHCATNPAAPGTITTTNDCGTSSLLNDPGHLLAFEPFSGNKISSSDQYIYWFDTATNSIKKSTNGTLAGGTSITSPSIKIETFDLYVLGSSSASATGDTKQPRITLLVKGTIGVGTKIATDFHIQTTITERLIDF